MLHPDPPLNKLNRLYEVCIARGWRPGMPLSALGAAAMAFVNAGRHCCRLTIDAKRGIHGDYPNVTVTQTS